MIIASAGSVGLLEAAEFTLVNNYEFVLFITRRHGWHQSPTQGQAVAWLNIDMPSPQAMWAVIRVAAPLNNGVAMEAGKIFIPSGEGHNNKSKVKMQKSKLSYLGKDAK